MSKHFHSWTRFAVIILIIFTLYSWIDLFPKDDVPEIAGAVSGSITMCINRQPELNQSCSTSANSTKAYECVINGSSRESDQTETFLDNTSLFAINSTGGITFTPAEADVGNHSILVAVEDNSSCANNRTESAFSLEIVSGCTNTVPDLNISCNATVSAGNVFSCIINGSAEDDNQYVNFTDNSTYFTINETGGINFSTNETILGLFQFNITITDNSTCSDNLTRETFNLTIERVCGDGICHTNESSSSCSADCGTTAAEEEEIRKKQDSKRRTGRPKKPPPETKPKTPQPSDSGTPSSPIGEGKGKSDQPSQLVGQAGEIVKNLIGILKENPLLRSIILTILTGSIIFGIYHTHKKKIRLKNHKPKKSKK